ncbi:MAG: DUF1846 domain-containing protein [Oscillospiraceae bacterium]|nr:DUF1846 domain-containing protein [Oscillospiraceae bacterium]
MRTGFDNEKYLREQSQHIRERMAEFDGKLYLEFGGKLFDDHHASRVLPGFEPDSKIRMLMQVKDEAEIVVAISAGDIEKSKKRDDYGITYEDEVLRVVDAFRDRGLYVGSVVITRFAGQSSAVAFRRKLQSLGLNVFLHYPIEGYPTYVDHIVSDEGFGKNDYIETTRKLVVVTGPGPGSGKMATCLSQLYHDSKRGLKSGYAKFETFPIWNIPLKHPVNLAYEAATADLDDVNMIDPFHLEAYGETTVNYNRDIEIFPVLRETFMRIMGYCPYKSPTDMGVNMAGFCIIDNEACEEASRMEIIRRYYAALVRQRKGDDDGHEATKIEMIMKQAGISVSERKVIQAALEREEETGRPACAIELPNGKILSGKTTDLLGSASAALLNALKELADIPDPVLLMHSGIIKPVQKLKDSIAASTSGLLHIDEILIALCICAINDRNAAAALAELGNVRGSELHSTVILSSVDLNTLKELGINVTCEPKFETQKLYNT